MKRNELTRWLIGITRPTLAPLIGSALCRIVDQGMSLALLGWASYRIVGVAGIIAEGDAVAAYVGITIGVLIIGSLIKALAHYLEHFLGHWVAFHALELLRSNAYHDLAPQAPGVMARNESGDFLTRLTRDIDRIEVFFAHTFAPLVSVIAVPLVLFAWLWGMLGLGVATLFVLWILIGTVVAPLWGMKRERRATTSTMGTRSVIAQSVTDTIQGMREVVGYGQERERLRQLDRLASRAAESQKMVARVNGVRRGLVRATQLLAIATPAVIAYPQMQHNPTLIGAVLAATLMSARCWEMVRGVEGFAEGLKESFAAAERVYRLTHGPALPGGKQRWPATPVIEFHEVCYHYRDSHAERHERPALQNVSLRIEPGQWVCLTGHTGCGKSTLSRLLLRYDDPTAGMITIGGTDVRDFPLDELRSRIHFVTQNSALFHGTIRSNLLLAEPDATDDDMWRALELASIADEVRAFDAGLDQPIAEGGAGVSGGQRQRICLARALLTIPDVLVLDEFCSQLDPALDEEIHARLRATLGDTTVIEITHRDTGIDTADAVFGLSNGELISGPSSV
ncbi:MAG: ABC transporter ATP-binding protein [Actinomycetaceae bacterium]|nr:ABC transporter ATP-binding protein [Actinomycetaceae bacterium]